MSDIYFISSICGGGNLDQIAMSRYFKNVFKNTVKLSFMIFFEILL